MECTALFLFCCFFTFTFFLLGAVCNECQIRWLHFLPRGETSPLWTIFMDITRTILIVPGHCLMSRAFAIGPRDRGSQPISGQFIPKTEKMVLDATLLNAQDYKVSIKGKVEQSREWSSTLPNTSVVTIEKRSIKSPSTKVANTINNSDGEAPVLDPWEMWASSSLPLLPGQLRLGVVVPVRVPYIGQFNYLLYLLSFNSVQIKLLVLFLRIFVFHFFR